MKDDTKLVSLGRPHRRPHHPVSHAVERASTFLFPTYEDFLEGGRKIVYGRLGGESHRALEEAMTGLEGGFATRLASSGLQAVTAALLAFVKAGDRVLITDNVYDPTRKFADRFLARFGVDVGYFDPLSIAALKSQLDARVKVVFAESPGSLTFEVSDLKAIGDAAHAVGARLVVDNTWSGGYFLKPIALGADAVVQSGTKYLGGHSDLLIGSITSADAETAEFVFQALLQLGVNVSADDATLALRGMRTLAVRLARHHTTGVAIADYLARRPEVERVFHPARADCPGHDLWKRDFSGASGLFGALLKPTSKAQVAAFFNALKHFGMGYSWGGFESLCIEARPQNSRTARPWTQEGVLLRIHAGLEDPADLISDLEHGFAAFHAAGRK
jgi:cystathionine beta-lyase